MGIESEQLVFDYLSRVGDLAHRTPMSAAERARLVAEVRGDIERRRAAAGGAESAASVKRILGRLGKPEKLVERAVTGGPGSGSGESSPFGAAAAAEVPAPQPSASSSPSPPAASPPHLASEEELAPGPGADPDWWRVEPGPYGPTPVDGGHQVAGFQGGIEVPEMLRHPVAGKGGAGSPARPGGVGKQDGPGGPDSLTDAPARTPEPVEDLAPTVPQPAVRRPRLRRWPRPGKGGGGAGGVVEWCAAAALVAGAVLGVPFALGLGWVLAYWSPRLSRPEAKAASMGLPGTVAAGGLVWVWGRSTERWGEDIPEGELGQELLGTLPVVLRVAAVVSALFLVWRARRRAG